MEEAKMLLSRMGTDEQLRCQRDLLDDRPPQQSTRLQGRRVVRPRHSRLPRSTAPPSPQDSSSQSPSPLMTSSPPPHVTPSPPRAPSPLPSPPRHHVHPASTLSMWSPMFDLPHIDYMDLEYSSESNNLDEMDWTSEPVDPDVMWWEPTPPYRLIYLNCCHSGVNHRFGQLTEWEDEEEESYFV
eukprot:g99.t1